MPPRNVRRSRADHPAAHSRLATATRCPGRSSEAARPALRCPSPAGSCSAPAPAEQSIARPARRDVRSDPEPVVPAAPPACRPDTAGESCCSSALQLVPAHPDRWQHASADRSAWNDSTGNQTDPVIPASPGSFRHPAPPPGARHGAASAPEPRPPDHRDAP